jgi:ABC-type enterochelin transport system ATPase subunit
MTTAEPLIKSYRPKTQVDGVDRTVQTGKVTSLRGPNCAGKVTARRVVVRLDRRANSKATGPGRPYAQYRPSLTPYGFGR